MIEERLREIQLHKNNHGLDLLIMMDYEEESKMRDLIIGMPISCAKEVLLSLEELSKKRFSSDKEISFYGFSKEQRRKFLKELKKEYRNGNYKNLPCIHFS